MPALLADPQWQPCLVFPAEYAQALAAWLDVFSAHYLSAKRNLPLDRESPAHQWLQALAAPPR